MSIVKEAFVEGRETEVSWDESKSKQKEIKLEKAADHIHKLSVRGATHDNIPLQQICPTTNKVLRIFPTRLAAAKWIVTNVLKRPNKNPISVTGNMAMCMLAGWKSYGYYWKICTVEELANKAKSSSGSEKVYVSSRYSAVVFPSITEAATYIGIDRKCFAKKLRTGEVLRYGQNRSVYWAQLFNDTPKVIKFSSLAEGMRKTVFSETFLKKLTKGGKMFNNCTYKIETE